MPTATIADIEAPTANVGMATAADIEQDHSTFTSALKEYWNKINPLAQGNAIVGAGKNPKEAVQGYGAQTADLLDRAEIAFKQHDYAGAVRHGLSFLLNGIPGVGAALDEAGNKAQGGDYAGAAADTAALATNLYLGAKAPKIAGGVAEGIQSVPAVAGAVKNAAGSEAAGVAADAVGLVSPRAAHAISLARRGGRILGRIQQAIGAEEKAAPVAAAESAEPEASLVTPANEGGSTPRSAERQAIVDELNKPNPTPAPANTITSPQTAENAPAISAREAGNRTQLAQDLAEFLHSKGEGISHADALRMGPDQWKLARSAVRPTGKASTPSPATVQLTLEHLKELWGDAEATAKPTPTPINTPLRGKSLDIAQQLQAEMAK